VYRFFAWGMIPIGSALGGLTVLVVEAQWGREAALRSPWFVSAALGLLLAVYAVPRLTSARLDGARDEALAAKAAVSPAASPAGDDGQSSTSVSKSTGR